MMEFSPASESRPVLKRDNTILFVVAAIFALTAPSQQDVAPLQRCANDTNDDALSTRMSLSTRDLTPVCLCVSFDAKRQTQSRHS